MFICLTLVLSIIHFFFYWKLIFIFSDSSTKAFNHFLSNLPQSTFKFNKLKWQQFRMGI